MTVQACVRGVQARRVVDARMQAELDMLEAEEEMAMVEGGAATSLQSMWRGRVARQEVDSRLQEEMRAMEEDDAATRIQSRYRGIEARKQFEARHPPLSLSAPKVPPHIPTPPSTSPVPI